MELFIFGQFRPKRMGLFQFWVDFEGNFLDDFIGFLRLFKPDNAPSSVLSRFKAFLEPYILCQFFDKNHQ